MDLGLKNKTILVTAASRGLGYGAAKALVEEGAKVIICGRSEESLKNAITSLGPNSQYFVADVSKSEDIAELIDHVKQATPKLDGLFVNAGGPPPGTFSDLSDEHWKSAFELTLMSSVRLTRESLPLLRNSNSPSILYSTSISVKEPIQNLLLSNAIRPAIVGMMRTISDEIGPEGIRVNAICPGYVYTKRVDELLAKSKEGISSAKDAIEARIPLKRMGTPEEFGAVCAFLLSPKASYVHGALLLVDGGLYRGMM
jgi:3-oxoacyl-[acyl-carrier protein] reductase